MGQGQGPRASRALGQRASQCQDLRAGHVLNPRANLVQGPRAFHDQDQGASLAQSRGANRVRDQRANQDQNRVKKDRNLEADPSRQVDPNLGASPNLEVCLDPSQEALLDLNLAPNLNHDRSQEVGAVAVVQTVMWKIKRKKLSKKLLAEIPTRKRLVRKKENMALFLIYPIPKMRTDRNQLLLKYAL